MRFFLSLISVFGLAATSGAAIAAPAPRTINSTVSQVTVSHRDLDLRTNEGAATLKGRVDRAVRQVCGQSSSERTLFDRTQQRSCAKQARREADADVARTINSARQSSIAFGSVRQGPNWER